MKKLFLILLIAPLFWGCEKVEFSSYPNWLQQGKWQLVDISVSNSVDTTTVSIDSALISESVVEAYGNILKLKKDFASATPENKLKKYTFWEFVTDDRLKILVNPKDDVQYGKVWDSEIPINFSIDFGQYVGFKMLRNGHPYTFTKTGYRVMVLSAPKVVTMIRRNGNVEIFVSEYTTLTFHNK
jgi:hypothetical protein